MEEKTGSVYQIYYLQGKISDMDKLISSYDPRYYENVLRAALQVFAGCMHKTYHHRVQRYLQVIGLKQTQEALF